MAKISRAASESIYTLGAVTLLHFLAVAESLRLHPRTEELADWSSQYSVLLVMSYVLALWICLAPKGPGTHRRLALQIVFIFFMNYPEQGNISMGAILFSIPLLEAILLPSSPLWPSLFIPVAAVFSALFHPLPFWDDAAPATDPTDVLVLAGVMVLEAYIVFRVHSLSKSAAAQAERIERLNRSIDNLLGANLDFQTYAAEIGEKSTTEERKRLTREVHDIVGYTMINLRMMMEAAVELTPPDNKRLKDLLEQARDQTQSGLLETRRALRNFRAMDSAVVEPANRIHRLVQSFSQATGIDVEVSYGNMPRSFGQEIDATLIRIIQESMTNAFRHGKATEIKIGIWTSESSLLVRVADNGVGAAEVKPGIGIAGMAERIESLKGSFTAKGGDYGFTVDASIPLAG